MAFTSLLNFLLDLVFATADVTLYCSNLNTYSKASRHPVKTSLSLWIQRRIVYLFATEKFCFNFLQNKCMWLHIL